MDQMLDGRVIVVTGAAGGVGAAIVDRLGAAGAHVVAVARSATDGLPPDGGSLVLADLCDSDSPAQIVEATTSTHGAIDGLVNCAAIQTVVDFTSMSDADWHDVIDTDLTAAHRLTRAVADSMIRGGHRGSIVHIASIEASRPAEGHSHYSVAKAGLVMHAKAAALELGRHGIRVNSISPGLIERPGIESDWPAGVAAWKDRAPLGRLGTGRDIAEACLFLLSDMSDWITGTDLVVDGGMSTRQPW